MDRNQRPRLAGPATAAWFTAAALLLLSVTLSAGHELPASKPSPPIILDNSPEAIELDNRQHGSVTVRVGPFCGNREQMLEHFERRWAEKREARGLLSGGAMLEILTSPTGDFTVLVTRPGGVACVKAFGKAWEHLGELRIERSGGRS